MTGLFIEETKPDYSYAIVWRQGEKETIEDALNVLKSYPSKNRLELWNKALGESSKGFAPFAFREKGSNVLMVCNTLKMLAGM